MSAHVVEKSTLRKQLRAARRSLPPSQYARLSRLAAQAVARLPQFSAGRKVALYLPFDREVDTAALIAAARKRGVRIFMPVVADRRRRRLAFRRHGRRTRPGVYGIPVPTGKRVTLGARWFDLVVVPLVGVDADGRRLGMGGGYYDRALGFRSQRKSWRGPHVVGLAFDCQRVASVCAEAWDLRFDSVATESGIQHYD
jgi:5-formyltetrahydrofolate cyclo-ligase